MAAHDTKEWNSHLGNDSMLSLSPSLPCLLFYSRVTNYMIFGHYAITFQMSEHCVGVSLCFISGVFACVYLGMLHIAVSWFSSCSGSCFMDPPLSYLLQKPVEASTDLEIND